MTASHQQRLEAFVASFNDGAVNDFPTHLDEAFYDYTPRPGEATQHETFAEVAAGLRSGFPDGNLRLVSITEDGEDLVAEAVFAGHLTGELFGVPGLGQQYELTGTIRSRSREGGLALSFEGVNIVQNLRIAGVLPYPTWGHHKPAHPPALPEVLVRLAFNGGAMQEKDCAHLDTIAAIEPTADTCGSCEAEGTEWPALRQCLTCGHVGCCDASTAKHAKHHHEETGHPLVRSISHGEAWIWCYADSAILSSWHLTGR